MTLYCSHFKALGAPDCCDPCHEDDEAGYHPLCGEGEWQGQEYKVCCRVGDWIHEQPTPETVSDSL